MKVFVTSAYEPQERTFVPLIHELALRCRFGIHKLVTDPDEADIVLFVDSNHHLDDLSRRAIRTHPLAKRCYGKVFVYDESDQPVCFLPGLYVSMPASDFRPQWQKAAAYLGCHTASIFSDLEMIECSPSQLFCFMGRTLPGIPVRHQILAMKSPRGSIEDTSSNDLQRGLCADLRQRYARGLADAKFILCPRGAGTSTYRLFEAMALRRVPVILSDEWVPPEGPDWPSFSIRVRESRVREIPAILERRENDFPRMAQAAREAWEQWFAPDVLFHRMIAACQVLLEAQGTSGAIPRPRLTQRFLRLSARRVKHRLTLQLRTLLCRAGLTFVG